MSIDYIYNRNQREFKREFNKMFNQSSEYIITIGLYPLRAGSPTFNITKISGFDTELSYKILNKIPFDLKQKLYGRTNKAPHLKIVAALEKRNRFNDAFMAPHYHIAIAGVPDDKELLEIVRFLATNKYARLTGYQLYYHVLKVDGDPEKVNEYVLKHIDLDSTLEEFSYYDEARYHIIK